MSAEARPSTVEEKRRRLLELESRRRRRATAERDRIPAASRERPLPLSYQQEAMWFLDRLDPRRSPYHLLYALRLRGPLDPAALAGALTTLVGRHESLRTRFDDRDGVPFQVI